MSSNHIRAVFGSLALVLAGLLPSHAQSPDAVGILTYAEHAKTPGAALTTGTTIFSGDLVETEADGKAQLQAGSIRLTLFGDSSFRLFHSPGGLVIELERGTMAYALAANQTFLLYALDVRVRPIVEQGAAGQITVVTRCDVRVTSQRGAIEVLKENEKQKGIVEDSKNESFRSLRAVDYHDTWKPIPADYPDFDPNSQYHHSHSHVACPAAFQKGPALHAGSATLARAGEAAIVGAGIGIIVYKALESPDGKKP